MFSQITDLMEEFKNHLPPKQNVSNRINIFLETNSSSASQKISFETRQRIEQIEKRKAYLKQSKPIAASTVRGECAPIGDLVPRLKENNLNFSQALEKLDRKESRIPLTQFIKGGSNKQSPKPQTKNHTENQNVPSGACLRKAHVSGANIFEGSGNVFPGAGSLGDGGSPLTPINELLKENPQIPPNCIEKEKTKVESKEKKENERQETSFERLKEKHKAEKLQIVPNLQKTKGLQTKECRKAIILCLLNDYNQMEKKVCFASNDKLLSRLKEFCFEINERTLKRDLKELKEQGLIEIQIDKYQNQYYQVRTSRSIKTKESINTFCPTEDQMDFNRNKFKSIFIEISNKFLRAKKSLQENYERIKKYYELRKQEKRNKSKPINVHEVVEYFISELRKPASKAIDFFNWYSKRDWLDSGGKQINSWQRIATVWD